MGMSDRWQRIHGGILLPVTAGLYLIFLRRGAILLLIFYHDYPMLVWLEQLVFPGLITVAFSTAMIYGYIQVQKEREWLEKREEFIRNVGHELNTPLAILMGHVENALVGAYPNDDPAIAWEKAHHGARRFRWVIENLMYTITLSNGVPPFDLVSLHDIVIDSVDEMSDKAAYRSAAVSTKTDKSLMVEGNARLLRAAVTNLIDNGIKFATDTDIRVEVLLYADNGNAVIQVKDNGIGIHPNRRKAIFDMFRQGDGGMTRKYGGLGLGLAIVHQVARMHKGRVEVESELGHGSTFRLIVPRSKRW